MGYIEYRVLGSLWCSECVSNSKMSMALALPATHDDLECKRVNRWNPHLPTFSMNLHFS